MEKITFEKACFIREEIDKRTEIIAFFKNDNYSLAKLADYVQAKDLNLFQSAKNLFKNSVLDTCHKIIEELEREFSKL